MTKELSNKEKIDVLLHEYTTLRNEILNNQNHLFQLFAICGAVFIWIMVHPLDRRFWLAVAVAVPALCYGLWVIRRDVDKAAKRIRQLEKAINALAGDELLVWETHWGGAVTGYWGRARPLPFASSEVDQTSGERNDKQSPKRDLSKSSQPKRQDKR